MALLIAGAVFGRRVTVGRFAERGGESGVRTVSAAVDALS